jgi:hypothetical protein
MNRAIERDLAIADALANQKRAFERKKQLEDDKASAAKAKEAAQTAAAEAAAAAKKHKEDQAAAEAAAKQAIEDAATEIENQQKAAEEKKKADAEKKERDDALEEAQKNAAAARAVAARLQQQLEENQANAEIEELLAAQEAQDRKEREKDRQDKKTRETTRLAASLMAKVKEVEKARKNEAEYKKSFDDLVRRTAEAKEAATESAMQEQAIKQHLDKLAADDKLNTSRKLKLLQEANKSLHAQGQLDDEELRTLQNALTSVTAENHQLLQNFAQSNQTNTALVNKVTLLEARELQLASHLNSQRSVHAVLQNLKKADEKALQKQSEQIKTMKTQLKEEQQVSRDLRVENAKDLIKFAGEEREYKEQIGKIRSEKKDLMADIEKTKSALSGSHVIASKMSARMHELKSSMHDLQGENEDLGNDLIEREAKIEALLTEVELGDRERGLLQLNLAQVRHQRIVLSQINNDERDISATKLAETQKAANDALAKVRQDAITERKHHQAQLANAAKEAAVLEKKIGDLAKSSKNFKDMTTAAARAQQAKITSLKAELAGVVATAGDAVEEFARLTGDTVSEKIKGAIKRSEFVGQLEGRAMDMMENAVSPAEMKLYMKELSAMAKQAVKGFTTTRTPELDKLGKVPANIVTQLTDIMHKTVLNSPRIKQLVKTQGISDYQKPGTRPIRMRTGTGVVAGGGVHGLAAQAPLMQSVAATGSGQTSQQEQAEASMVFESKTARKQRQARGKATEADKAATAAERKGSGTVFGVGGDGAKSDGPPTGAELFDPAAKAEHHGTSVADDSTLRSIKNKIEGDVRGWSNDVFGGKIGPASTFAAIRGGVSSTAVANVLVDRATNGLLAHNLPAEVQKQWQDAGNDMEKKTSLIKTGLAAYYRKKYKTLDAYLDQTPKSLRFNNMAMAAVDKTPLDYFPGAQADTFWGRMAQKVPGLAATEHLKFEMQPGRVLARIHGQEKMKHKLYQMIVSAPLEDKKINGITRQGVSKHHVSRLFEEQNDNYMRTRSKTLRGETRADTLNTVIAGVIEHTAETNKPKAERMRARLQELGLKILKGNSPEVQKEMKAYAVHADKIEVEVRKELARIIPRQKRARRAAEPAVAAAFKEAMAADVAGEPEQPSAEAKATTEHLKSMEDEEPEPEPRPEPKPTKKQLRAAAKRTRGKLTQLAQSEQKKTKSRTRTTGATEREKEEDALTIHAAPEEKAATFHEAPKPKETPATFHEGRAPQPSPTTFHEVSSEAKAKAAAKAAAKAQVRKTLAETNKKQAEESAERLAGQKRKEAESASLLASIKKKVHSKKSKKQRKS